MSYEEMKHKACIVDELIRTDISIEVKFYNLGIFFKELEQFFDEESNAQRQENHRSRSRL